MPLFWLSIAFIAGLLAGSTTGFISAWPFWVGAAILGWSIGKFSTDRFPQVIENIIHIIKIKPLILVAAFLLGAIRYQLGLSTNTFNNLARYNDRGLVEVTGWVADAPDERENSTRLQVAVTEIKHQSVDGTRVFRKPRGRLLVQLPEDSGYQYGDMLTLSGNLSTPDEGTDFLYREYLASRDILSIMNYPRVTSVEVSVRRPLMRALLYFRQNAYQHLRQLLPMPESALLGGIMLGIETDIPAPVEKAFQDTGTSHIIVISGSNISVLSILLAFFLRKLLDLRWTFIVTIAGISVYTLLVGGDPPVLRAAFMGVLGGLATLLGRQQSGFNSLAFTAAVMCLFQPLLLWSASFQLSFGATAGILLLGGPLVNMYAQVAEKFLSSETIARLAGPISDYVLLTLAAQIGIFPIAAYHFHRISISSFLANLLILPAQPPIMALGGMTLVATMIFEPLGQIFAWLVWVPLTYSIRIVEAIASTWSGNWNINILPIWAVILLYLVLVALVLPSFQPIMKRLLSWVRQRIRLNTAIAILLFANLFVWHAGLYRLDPHLQITLLNEGSSILVQTPQKRNLLINGGPSANRLSWALDRRMGLFQKDLDFLIVTEQTPSALAGLIDIQERFEPHQALIHDAIPENSTLRRLQTSLSESNIDLAYLETGHTIRLNPKAELKILEVTDTGAAIQITWDRFCALIPGGIEPDIVLENTNTCPVRDQGIVILSAIDLESASKVNTWLTLGPLAVIANDGTLAGSDVQPPMISTWKHGWIEINTDGSRFWLESQR